MVFTWRKCKRIFSFSQHCHRQRVTTVTRPVSCGGRQMSHRGVFGRNNDGICLVANDVSRKMTGLFLPSFRRRTNTRVFARVPCNRTHISGISTDVRSLCYIRVCDTRFTAAITRLGPTTTWRKCHGPKRVGDAQSKMSNDEDINAAAETSIKKIRFVCIDCARTYRFGPIWFSTSRYVKPNVNPYTKFGLRTLRERSWAAKYRRTHTRLLRDPALAVYSVDEVAHRDTGKNSGSLEGK